MLLKRILTAALGLPIVIGILQFGKIEHVNILLTIFVGISIWEAFGLIVAPLEKRIGLPSGAATPAGVQRLKIALVLSGSIFFYASYFWEQSGLAWVTFVFAWFGVSLFSSDHLDTRIARVHGNTVALVYGTMPWFSIRELYLLNGNASFVFLLMAIVMGCDTGAYFSGKHLGKRSLSPTLSPNKTWEGVIGGTLAAAVLTLLLSFFFESWKLKYGSVLLISIPVALAGVAGDLLESALKRFSGVKDSGRIFPGHGGLLDRVDALIFSAPVLWLLLSACL